MPKPLPSLDISLLLPPVDSRRYAYFENAASHPFECLPALANAWWLAECAFAAYAEAGPARDIFLAAGLRAGAPIHGTLRGGQGYVLSDEEKIIVAFRGSHVLKPEHFYGLAPFHDMVRKVMRDLMTNASVQLVPWAGRSGGRVHRGFAASLEELLPQVVEQVNALRRERPERTLWLTGHSLGAGLATLAADRMEGVDGLHTFGSPQVGDGEFAARFKVPGWRFRNHADAVAWLPGTMLGYVHTSGGKYFNRHDELKNEPGPLVLLADGAMGLPAAAKAALEALLQGQSGGLAPEALNDHAPIMYAVKTWNALVSSGQD